MTLVLPFPNKHLLDLCQAGDILSLKNLWLIRYAGHLQWFATDARVSAMEKASVWASPDTFTPFAFDPHLILKAWEIAPDPMDAYFTANPLDIRGLEYSENRVTLFIPPAGHEKTEAFFHNAINRWEETPEAGGYLLSNIRPGYWLTAMQVLQPDWGKDEPDPSAKHQSVAVSIRKHTVRFQRPDITVWVATGDAR